MYRVSCNEAGEDEPQLVRDVENILEEINCGLNLRQKRKIS